MPLRVGALDDDERFVELSEGQDVTLLWGYQGYLMLSIDVAAEVELDGAPDSCLRCESSIASPTDAFSPVELQAMQPFTPLSPGFFTTHMFLVLAEDKARYDGQSAQLSITCAGHGHTGATENVLGLVVPPR